MTKTQPKALSFARHRTQPQTEEPMHTATENKPAVKPQASATGSITLASATRIDESDPMKAELLRKGYIIVSENEYGCVVRQAKGKPTFMAKTKEGYKEGDKRNTLILPDSIDRAMKMRVASTGCSVMQYLTQLVMQDLKANHIEV
jgi:hypothetical protein